MDDQVLYRSKEFTLFGNKVIQGKFESIALDPHTIISNYADRGDNQHPRGLRFKFSLNGGDNELPVFDHHFLVLRPEKGMVETPVIRFGEKFQDQMDSADSYLEEDTFLRVRLDMQAVFDSFDKLGYYETYNGQKIQKEDFKGVFIAGDTPPLSWDFNNLPVQDGVELKDKEGKGIYEVTLHLNESKPKAGESNQWKLSEEIGDSPQYRSPYLMMQALYNMSLEEVKLNIRPDRTFMAGEEWFGVWTRDISYSILLSLAAIEPEISKQSLLKKVERERIVQDTGTGGSWPVSTDRVSWSIAAWEIYLVNGDREWLRQSFSIIKNTIEDDLQVAYNPKTGLFYGESSFLDWREQSYPAWMEPADIYHSQCLGTNVVHFKTYQILALMAERLGEPAEAFAAMAKKIKKGINRLLWVEERGYYGQYLYGRTNAVLSPRAEGLGEALAVLFDVADKKRKQQIIRNNPNVPFGCPSIFPQIPGIPPYHNNGIWPFVHAYWTWSAATQKNEEAVRHGLASMYRQAALFLTNKENFVAESGDDGGTVINSNRQLWSVAGNLAMVYRVLYGMHFEEDGLSFRPFVPETYSGDHKLDNFRYRGTVLNITLRGWGDGIKSFILDGRRQKQTRIPGDLTGTHEVEIVMNNNKKADIPFTLIPNCFSPVVPQVRLEDGALKWLPVDKAIMYEVWCNGSKVHETAATEYALPEVISYSEFQVLAVDAEGYSSFLSVPIVNSPNEKVYLLGLENFAEHSCECDGYSGKGYVTVSTEANTNISIPVDIAESGLYLVDIRYSNGSGPVHTDNKAAIRSLRKGDEYLGSIVFPQRGEGDWSNWGWSSALHVSLKKGVNQLIIKLEPCNINMNKSVNTAFLDQLRLVKLK